MFTQKCISGHLKLQNVVQIKHNNQNSLFETQLLKIKSKNSWYYKFSKFLIEGFILYRVLPKCPQILSYRSLYPKSPLATLKYINNELPQWNYILERYDLKILTGWGKKLPIRTSQDDKNISDLWQFTDSSPRTGNTV